MDFFQCVQVFLLLGTADLAAALQVRSQEGRVEGKSHLPLAAGHTTFDAAQDTAVFVGCEDVLLGFVELFLNQLPQYILLQVALNPFSTQPSLNLYLELLRPRCRTCTWLG